MADTVLLINTSGTMAGSATRAATAQILADLAPAKTITRDLAVTPLPQVDEAWINARLVPGDAQSDADRATLALSDTLVAELKEADTIVIGMPMYNFGMPAALKAWADLVARPKITFAYTENGPVGLVEGKKVIVAAASGGVPIGSPADFATPHLTLFLGFLGITDVTIKNAQDITAAAA